MDKVQFKAYMIVLRKLNIFMFLTFLLFGIEPREHPLPLKISVIVPCHPTHFPLLDPLFAAYERQTSRPDEIVVSLSESHLIPDADVQALEKKAWPFRVLMIQSRAKQLPGTNRNVACKAAQGDLIVCQDADDLPHPQRIEAVRYLFEHFKVEHLLHQWLPSDGTFEPFQIQGLERECVQYRNYEQIDLPRIHNGSVCFLRSVFEQIHWRPHLTIDEDSIFNRHSYAFFPAHYVLSQPLIHYRGELSTFDLNGDKQR